MMTDSVIETFLRSLQRENEMICDMPTAVDRVKRHFQCNTEIILQNLYEWTPSELALLYMVVISIFPSLAHKNSQIHLSEFLTMLCDLYKTVEC